MTDTINSQNRAFVFPGQGSQALGMGKDLAESFPAAKAVFEEVDEALGQDLSGLMWGEDLAALTLTENTQPALMAVSLAVMRALESEGYELAKHGAFVAGHSLGEYSALAASGVLSLTDCAKLLKLRGQAMQRLFQWGRALWRLCWAWIRRLWRRLPLRRRKHLAWSANWPMIMRLARVF